MLISDVLRTKGREVVRVHTTDTVRAAVGKLAEHRIGAVMVEDKWMKLVGIFTERDLVGALAHEGPIVLEREVQTLMTSPFISCRPGDRIDAVLGLMTLRRIRHLPVMEEGKLAGIVSIGDLVKHRLDEKELEANTLLEISRMRV